MNKTQILVLAIFAVLFCLIYFGLDTKPQEHKLVEKSRALNLESTTINNLLREAYQQLSKNDIDLIKALDLQLKNESDSLKKAEIMETLSSNWFSFGQEAIAGHYAEQIANIKQTDEAWSIAGTTYAIGIQKSDVQKVKDFCFKGAVNAFENAISLNPDEQNHKINLAICFVDNPPADNPMKGISMLLEMNREQPDNINVLLQLARLGIQTGQYDKALDRLNKVLSLEPENKKAFCLLSTLYDSTGKPELAQQYQEKCRVN